MRALLLCLLLLTAGCVSSPSPGEAEGEGGERQVETLAPANATGPTTGSLVVRARMPDLSVLPGTTVVAGNATRTTDAEGVARFEDLPAGPIDVTARKEAHRTAQLEATIVAGQELELEAVLPALVETDQHAHEKGLYAHRDLYRFEGHFDCSATYVIITGSCTIVVENVTSTAGVPDPTANATTARHLIDFALDASWSALVVEMNWTTPEASVEDGMTLALEPAEAPSDGHAAKYARVAGASPLRVELLPGVEHETATTGDMPQPEGGEVLRARAFVMGKEHRPGGTDFLGVGVAKDQRFTLWVSIFYGEPAPQGYTALE